MYKPVHFLIFFLALLFYQSLSAQLTWVKHVEVDKNFTTGGSIFSFVKQMDSKNASRSLAQYGYFSRTKQYDFFGNTIIQNYGDSNSVKRVNGIWQSAGKINFSNSHSAIYAHDTILGKEYIGVAESNSGGAFVASFLVLNTSSNRYERVANLGFDQRVAGFVYLGNNKTLLFGDFFEASDGTTTQVYNGMAIWDMGTNLLSYASGNVNFGGYNYHSSGKDGATLIAYASYTRLCFVLEGILDWTGTLLPKNPIGGRMINVKVINKDTIYGLWQKDSVDWPCYLMKFIRSQGMSWQEWGRLTSTSANTGTSRTWVNSIDLLNGKLRLSTEATHFNGQLLGNNVFDVDPNSGGVSNLPITPISPSLFRTSRLTLVDGETYLISDNNLSGGVQTIYVLRDLSVTSTRETNSLQKTTSLFPIPASATVYLKNAKSFLTISGIDGKVFYKVSATSGSNYIELDISFLPAGIYIASCLNKKNEVERHKFVVKR